jgi:hypothetical protein
MTPEETFRQLLGLGNAWRVVEARLEAGSSTFIMKVEEMPDLWPEESARTGTPVVCHDHVEPMQWRHLNVFKKECVIVCSLPRDRRSEDGKAVPCDPTMGGAQQELHSFATPGKDASVWAAFAAEMMRHNGHPKAVQHLAIDMSAAYAKGVGENLGNALLAYDKFHVFKNVLEACDEVRKAESRADAGKGIGWSGLGGFGSRTG